MARVSHVYASPWLKADDLNGSSVNVTIARTTVETLPGYENNPAKQKITLDFVGIQSKRFALNKTQAKALAAFVGDESDRWTGLQIVLTPVPTSNGRWTIAVTPAAPAPTNNPQAATDNPFEGVSDGSDNQDLIV